MSILYRARKKVHLFGHKIAEIIAKIAQIIIIARKIEI